MIIVNGRLIKFYEIDINQDGEALIPSSITSIGNEAFAECSNLTTVTIPASVTSIGDQAFKNCTDLTQITIPDSVQFIGKGAFAFCSKLTKIVIPKSLTNIMDATFNACTSLKEVIFHDSVRYIGKLAFDECNSLAQLTLPPSLIIIEDEAFCNCYGFPDITIPSSVEYIGEMAFYGCNATKITIPESVKHIGLKAFSSGITLFQTLRSPFEFSMRMTLAANNHVLQTIVIDSNNEDSFSRIQALLPQALQHLATPKAMVDIVEKQFDILESFYVRYRLIPLTNTKFPIEILKEIAHFISEGEKKHSSIYTKMSAALSHIPRNLPEETYKNRLSTVTNMYSSYYQLKQYLSIIFNMVNQKTQAQTFFAPYIKPEKNGELWLAYQLINKIIDAIESNKYSIELTREERSALKTRPKLREILPDELLITKQPSCQVGCVFA